MVNKHNFQPNTLVGTLELDRQREEDITTGEPSDEYDSQSYEEREGIITPNRETFTQTMETVVVDGEERQERKYKTLLDLWEDYPEATEQITETKVFLNSIDSYAKETNSEIVSLGYTDEGTFYATITEGDSQQNAYVVRMNPLDGPATEEGVARNAPLNFNYDRQTSDTNRRISATIDTEDSLGNKAQIILKNYDGGNAIKVGGETQPLIPAGDLATKLDYKFPDTPEGQARQREILEAKAESDEKSYRHL